MNRSELIFATVLEKQNKLYFEQPKMFELPMPYKSYRPDFYVVDDNTFYEVSGTRQAYSLGKDKYHSFRETYPHLKFKVVNPDGSIYRTYNTKIGSAKPSYKTKDISEPLWKLYKQGDNTLNQSIMIQSIIDSKLTIRAFAIKSDIAYSNLMTYLHNRLLREPHWVRLFLKNQSNN